MNVRLSPEHEKWSTEQVATGAFASVDGVVAWAIEGMIHLADDDHEWARPYPRRVTLHWSEAKAFMVMSSSHTWIAELNRSADHGAVDRLALSG